MYSSAVDDFESFIYENLKKNDENYNVGHFMSDGLIVVGNTGSGKSTFINFLMSNQLKVVINGGKIVIDSDSHPKICATKLAGTTFPFPYFVNDLMMNAWDTPGYSDTSTEKVEILNGVSIKALLGRLKGKIKIAYVIEENKLDGERGRCFIDEFEQFFNYIEDFSKVENSFFLVISKGGFNYVDESCISKAIMDILDSHGYLAESKYNKIKEVLRKIVSDKRIFLFIRPSVGENIYAKNSRPNLMNLVKTITFVKPEVVKVHHILSKSAHNYLIEAKNLLKKEMEQIFLSINSFFTSKIDVIIEENNFITQKINSLEILCQAINGLPQNLENYGVNNQLIGIKFFEEKGFQSHLMTILKQVHQKIEFISLFRTFDNNIEVLKSEYFLQMLSPSVSNADNKLNQLKIFWKEIRDKTNEMSIKINKVLTTANTKLKSSLNHLENCIYFFWHNDFLEDNSLSNLIKSLNDLEKENIDLENLNNLYKNLTPKQLSEIEKNLVSRIKPHFVSLQSMKEDQKLTKYARHLDFQQKEKEYKEKVEKILSDFEEKEKSIQNLNKNLRNENNALKEKETIMEKQMDDLNGQIYDLNYEINKNNGELQNENNSMNDLMTKITEKNEGLVNQVMILQQEIDMKKNMINELDTKIQKLDFQNQKLDWELSKKSKRCTIF